MLDVLFLEQMAAKFKDLALYVMVRGEEVLNDVTIEDAKKLIDNVDVILSKGQGNYESFSGFGRHTFYSFLCECDLFTSRFNVPKLTGVFISE